ncbi:MAG: hypothetical protein BGN83_21210 [Rhizobium sp. 63-7]|nr:MAG: hypothetical protein BGN83_21210 [Rhizobium sp. 63-7]
MDYRLDPDLRAYVEKVNAFYPPDALALPIGENRKIYNRMCRALRRPHPDGVSRTDRQADDRGHRIAVREYRTGAGHRPDARSSSTSMAAVSFSAASTATTTSAPNSARGPT